MLFQVWVGSAGSGVDGRGSVFLEHDVVPEVYEIDPLWGGRHRVGLRPWEPSSALLVGTLPPLTHTAHSTPVT